MVQESEGSKPHIRQQLARVWIAIHHPRLFVRGLGPKIERKLQKSSSIFRYGSMALVVVCAGYAATTHLHGFPRLAAWLPAGGTATFHFVNAIAFFGFVFGAFGLAYTVIQLRLFEARIEDYPDFYRWAKLSFDEFQSGDTRELWFMGSTILPGNVAHGIKSPEDIKDFHDGLLRAIDSRRGRSSSDATRPVRLLLPHLDGYEHTYGAYKRIRVVGVMDRSDKSSWEQRVEKCRDAASSFQRRLRTQDPAVGGVLERQLIGPLADEEGAPEDWPVDMRSVDHTAPQFQALRQGYLVCTDRRATYAMPIHYTKALGDQTGELVVPQLVGFTTTNGAIVRALRQLFEEVWDGAEPEGTRADLDRFYTRHLKDAEVESLWEELKKQLSSDVDVTTIVSELDEVDHDHFLGRVATQRCVEYLLPLPGNARVLDLGGGFGGPARYLASNYKTGVTVVDVSSKRVSLGREMFYGLRTAGHFFDKWGEVDFLNADLEKVDLAFLAGDHKFDAVISFLAILHCVEKRRLLRKLPGVLKNEGKFALTDFIAGSGLDRESAAKLKDIGCPSLLSREEYLANLNLGDGVVTGFRTVTSEWNRDADLRYQQISDNRAALITKYGERRVDDATALYAVVRDLFRERIVDGIEIWGFKRDR